MEEVLEVKSAAITKALAATAFILLACAAVAARPVWRTLSCGAPRCPQGGVGNGVRIVMGSAAVRVSLLDISECAADVDLSGCMGAIVTEAHPMLAGATSVARLVLVALHGFGLHSVLRRFVVSACAAAALSAALSPTSDA